MPTIANEISRTHKLYTQTTSRVLGTLCSQTRRTNISTQNCSIYIFLSFKLLLDVDVFALYLSQFLFCFVLLAMADGNNKYWQI